MPFFLLLFLHVFYAFSPFPNVCYGENGEASYYNEVFDEKGIVRPQYKEVYEAISQLSETAYKKFFREASKATKGDIPLSPTPRILTESEYESVKQGVEQRARTLQAFLKDHYYGKQTYRDKIIPEPIIDEILKRSGDDKFVSKIQKDFPFRFVYGPDLIRDKKGQWLVLEDNLGYVGGSPGDTVPTRELWQKLIPKVASKVPVQNDPREHVVDLFERMKATSSPSFGFKPKEGALVYLAHTDTADLEDPRMVEMLEKMGVTSITKNTGKKGSARASKSLIVKEDGVYLQEVSKYGAALPDKKVGFLWMSGEHNLFDGKDPLIYGRSLIEEAKEQLEDLEHDFKHGKKNPEWVAAQKQLEEAVVLDAETGQFSIEKLEKALRFSHRNYQDRPRTVLRSQSAFPGLLQAILDRKVESNYTPGIDFIGDKMFHTFMDDLVRHYLKEEPLLKSPKTRRFFKVAKDGSIVPDEKTFKDALANQEGRVAKIVDGRGGTGIDLGNRRDPRVWKKIIDEIRKSITTSISQDYTHPPVVFDGHQERIVDLRPISYVDEHGVLVSRTFFGRSTLKSGDGLMNMSAGNGVEMNVTIVPNPICKNGLTKAAEVPLQR